MIVRFLALSSAFLVLSELAGVLGAGSEPPGAVSNCGKVPRQLVGTAGTGYAPDLSAGPLARPVVLQSNLEVASVFRPFLDRMWHASPAFRAQWRRLAAGTGVRVSVLVEDLPRPLSLARARTVLKHQHGSLVDHLTTVVRQDRDSTPSSVRAARVSGSGRYVVFVSSAQLVEADRNRFGDIYVLDLATGECTLESVGPGGSPGNGESLSPDISRDGRYVVFESLSGNLLDTPVRPGTFHVFLRDRETGVVRQAAARACHPPSAPTADSLRSCRRQT